MRDSETIYELFTISRHIYVLGKLYKKKRRDRLERLKWEDIQVDWCKRARLRARKRKSEKSDEEKRRSEYDMRENRSAKRVWEKNNNV